MVKITVDPLSNPAFDNPKFSFETVTEWIGRYSRPLQNADGSEPSTYVPNSSGLSGNLIFGWIPYIEKNFSAEYFPIFSIEAGARVREVHILTGIGLDSFNTNSRIHSDTWVIEWSKDEGKTILQHQIQKIETTTALTSNQFYDQPIADFLNGNDEINGSKANDVINGFSGDDKLNGFSGDDKLNGGLGNDTIDGGEGIDRAIYSSTAAGYTIKITSSSSIATDRTANRDGTDTLTNVERLKFTDTMLALDTGKDQTAGSGYMLYKAAFNRTPDAGGLGYWINKMDTGMSYSAVAQNFVNSAEFKTAFGGSNPTVNTLVTKLYNNVLNRAPDAGGLAFWQEKLTTGWSTADVLGYFSTSGENVTNVTPLIANGIQYQQFVA